MSEKTGTEILMAQSPSIGEVIDRLNRRLAAAQEENAALREQLDRLKAELESANRAYADVMRAVDECGSYKP